MRLQRFILQILVLATTSAIVSCTDFREEEVPVNFGVDTNQLDFAIASSTRSVTVSSGTKWDVASMPSWISLGSISRSGRSPYEWIANFSAAENDEYNREGKIIIKAGSDAADLTITQEGKKGKYIAVESVSLSPTALTLTEGENASLTYSISPANASIKDVSWKSSAPSIATVSSSGRVDAVAEGTAKITVTTSDGNKIATSTVTVKAKVIPVTGVSLDRTSLSLTEGETYSLVATVTPSNATNKSVTWSSSNTTVATVSSSGVVTAKAAGSASITVKTADGAKTATCSVTVKAKTFAVTGVSLNKTSLAMTVGDTQTLTATVTPSNATDKSVTWSSSNTSVATVSSSGVVTAKAAGSATITVTTNDGGKKATCSVTVSTAKVAVTGVSLNKTSLSMTVGDTQTLTATVTPSNATDKSVTWSSSNTSVATVSSSGVVTAKAAGSAAITVTTNDGGKKATCSVTVQTIPVSSVSLDKTSLSLIVGETWVLSETVLPSNATDKSVTWSSSNTTVAKVSYLYGYGIVDARAPGEAVITVTTKDGGKTATCSVTVQAGAVAVTGVTLDKSSLSLIEGDTFTLTATVTPSNATNKSVNWSSTDTSVATVSSSGVVTAKSAGTATIIVSTVDGGKTATCSVTVQAQKISVTGVSLNKTSLSMTVGDTQTLTATVTPSNATDKSVTWSSSNTSVATVSSSGVVTAKAAGSTTISVTTNDGGKTATCSVTVQAQKVAVTGVSLNKTSLSMTVGDTQTLTATVTPSNATDKSVTWSSSNTSVATVSSSGLVTAKAAGSATITVKTNDGNKTATCAVTVTEKTVSVTGVSLNKTSLSMTEGDTQALTATVTPSNATDKSVTWSSSNTTVATVSSSGLVTAKAAGSAIITVKTNDGNKTATCSIMVTEKPISVTGVSLNTSSMSLTVGDTQTLVATLSPLNATDKSVTWSSNKTSVATVSTSGVVTAKAAGTATITVTTNDGGLTATCSVAVQAKDNHNYPSNSIHGAFSVSSTKQVCFARANLTKKGNLLDSQASIHTANYTSSDVTNGLIDIAETNVTEIISQSSDLGEPWRLLSKDEWTYLLEERKNANMRFSCTIQDGWGRGTLFAPDDWVMPADFGLLPMESGISNDITIDDLLALETYGFVYLREVNRITASPWGGLDYSRFTYTSNSGGGRYALSDPINVSVGSDYYKRKSYSGYRLAIPGCTFVFDRYDYQVAANSYGTMYSAVRAVYDL